MKIVQRSPDLFIDTTIYNQRYLADVDIFFIQNFVYKEQVYAPAANLHSLPQFCTTHSTYNSTLTLLTPAAK
jgi:hypothetical protein